VFFDFENFQKPGLGDYITKPKNHPILICRDQSELAPVNTPPWIFFIGFLWVTKVKPDVISVKVHPQLSRNGHPMDRALVGAVSLLPKLFPFGLSYLAHRYSWPIKDPVPLEKSFSAAFDFKSSSLQLL
jgi:hypothetical protein